jgi:hypothetical protein
MSSPPVHAPCPACTFLNSATAERCELCFTFLSSAAAAKAAVASERKQQAQIQQQLRDRERDRQEYLSDGDELLAGDSDSDDLMYTRNRSWACSHCTCINGAAALSCSACGIAHGGATAGAASAAISPSLQFAPSAAGSASSTSAATGRGRRKVAAATTAATLPAAAVGAPALVAAPSPRKGRSKSRSKKGQLAQQRHKLSITGWRDMTAVESQRGIAAQL